MVIDSWLPCLFSFTRSYEKLGYVGDRRGKLKDKN